MPAGVFYVIWSGRLVVFVGLAYGLEAMTRCDFSRKPMAIRRRQDCGFGALAAALSDALVLSQHPCSFDVLVAPAWSAPPAFALQGLQLLKVCREMPMLPCLLLAGLLSLAAPHLWPGSPLFSESRVGSGVARSSASLAWMSRACSITRSVK